MTPHPVRLVVSDDLKRSRLTVFFRLLLAIPHLILAALIGSAVLFAVFVNWWILLVRAQTPKGLHDFIAGYIRYVTHVEAYLFLAGNPYPGFYPFVENQPYPIDLEIDPPARQRRWTVFFRLFLALPVLLILTALFAGIGGGGRSSYFSPSGLAGTAACLIWFYALFTGRAPRGLRDLAAWGLGYSAQASAYLFLLTDRYPYSGPEGHLPPVGAEDAPPHPVTLQVTDDLRRSRMTVAFRLLLAFPHIFWLVGWMILALFAAFANWLSALVIGRSPRPLARFLSAYIRYSSHVSAFLYLIGNPFPGFVGKPGSYPIDVEVQSFEGQSRWVTLFRGILAVPTLAIGSAASGVLGVAAILGWFASLVRGRMPRGLRNGGAWAVGYNAQMLAYALVLTDRYPDSTPLRLLRDVG